MEEKNLTFVGATNEIDAATNSKPNITSLAASLPLYLINNKFIPSCPRVDAAPAHSRAPGGLGRRQGHASHS